LKNNRLVKLPRFLASLPNLHEIDVRGNNLPKIPRKLVQRRNNDEDGSGGDRFYIFSDVPDQILPNLYLGCVGCASNLTALKRLNITHVLTVASQCPRRPFPKEFKYMIIEAEDTNVYNIAQHFSACKKFINAGRKNGGVLVHCMQGRSRSGSVVIAYVMESEGLGYRDALQFVQRARSIVKPNPNFEEQLIKHEAVVARKSPAKPS